MTIILAALLATTTAHAGKLAEGFRGIPWGDPAPLQTPPAPDCRRPADPSGIWECDTEIGDADVQISYAVAEGLFIGVVIKTSGFANASLLHATLLQAYGDCRKNWQRDTSALADCIITDGNAVLGWEWNAYTKRGKAVLIDREVVDQSIEAEAKRAAAGVDDL